MTIKAVGGRQALDGCRDSAKPTVVITQTTKGKGISFMENDILWHYRFPHDGEEYDGAVAELDAQRPVVDAEGAVR